PALVAAPGVQVSTAEAYQALGRKLTIELPSRIINSFQGFVWCVGSGSPGLDWGCRNDFEAAVFRQHPQLKSIKETLLKLGARPAVMSGGGSTLFGIFDRREEREKAAASIRKLIGNGKVYPVSILSRRGYRALWRRQLGGQIDSRTWPPQSQHVVG